MNAFLQDTWKNTSISKLYKKKGRYTLNINDHLFVIGPFKRKVTECLNEIRL